jgi:hypothetical protein
VDSKTEKLTHAIVKNLLAEREKPETEIRDEVGNIIVKKKGTFIIDAEVRQLLKLISIILKTSSKRYAEVAILEKINTDLILHSGKEEFKFD